MNVKSRYKVFLINLGIAILGTAGITTFAALTIGQQDEWITNFFNGVTILYYGIPMLIAALSVL